jgi:hypothetical protein
MAFNTNRIVIENDGAIPNKTVLKRRSGVVSISGCSFNDKYFLYRDKFIAVFLPNICEVRIFGSNQKAVFRFAHENKILNLHHIKKIYEKETGRVIWSRFAPPAPRIVLSFRGIVLEEGDLPIGKGIFFIKDGKITGNFIDTCWAESCANNTTNNGNAAFILLKSACTAETVGQELKITWSGTSVTVPLMFLLEVYEKETGKKIWPNGHPTVQPAP